MLTRSTAHQTREFTPAFMAAFPSRFSLESLLKTRGYTGYPAQGSGGFIFESPSGQLVWKIADDPATAAFSDTMRRKPLYPALPRIFAMTPNGAPYTIIVMEKLGPFAKAQTWTDWYDNDFLPSKGVPLSDPFQVLPILVWLQRQAVAHGCTLDFQAKNVLVRRGTQHVVLFDPFH